MARGLLCRAGLVAALAALVAAAAHAAEDPLPLPATSAVKPLPPVDPDFFERVRLAALGDPQDLTEPLLPDDVAPPGQPPQEFEPPAGRKLPPGAKPGPLQQAIFTVTELPRLGAEGLGLRRASAPRSSTRSPARPTRDCPRSSTSRGCRPAG